MNNKIIEPIPIECPFCPSYSLELLQEERTLTVKNEQVKGMYWVYKCKSCKEQFTTTASDTESLKNFKNIIK